MTHHLVGMTEIAEMLGFPRNEPTNSHASTRIFPSRR